MYGCQTPLTDFPCTTLGQGPQGPQHKIHICASLCVVNVSICRAKFWQATIIGCWDHFMGTNDKSTSQPFSLSGEGNLVTKWNNSSTVLVLRMAHRIWRETKQLPSMLPGPRCAWLLPSFSPYLVSHPEHEHTVLDRKSRKVSRNRRISVNDRKKVGGGGLFGQLVLRYAGSTQSRSRQGFAS